MLHVQVGPSPLALGLIVPATLMAGFDVCIVGRPGDSSPREYGHAGSGPTGRLRYPEVTWFIGPATSSDLPDDLSERIQSDEPLLITCTLRGAISKRRPLIEEVLQVRPEGSETILLACENAPAPPYSEIATSCPGVDVRRTVVNRMCVGLKPDRDGRRMVSAHPLGEWLIERKGQGSTLLDALEAVDEVEGVDDIEARHDRKLWMVNGAHQALALMAQAANTDELQRVAQNPRITARLHHLHAAMDAALHHSHPGRATCPTCPGLF